MSGQGQALTLLFSLQFVLKNYGENPENYNEELRKLELLRQVSQAPSRIARSPGETCQSQTGGAGSLPALCLRTCLPAPTASLLTPRRPKSRSQQGINGALARFQLPVRREVTGLRAPPSASRRGKSCPCSGRASPPRSQPGVRSDHGRHASHPAPSCHRAPW